MRNQGQSQSTVERLYLEYAHLEFLTQMLAELISASAIGMIAFPAKSETKGEPNQIQHWSWLYSHSPASVLTEFKSAAVKLTVMVSLFSREKMTFVSVYKVSDLGILWSLNSVTWNNAIFIDSEKLWVMKPSSKSTTEKDSS